MTLLIVVNIIIFLLASILLYQLQSKQKSLSYRVFTALIFGVIFGTALQTIYGYNSDIVTASLNILDVVGSGYVMFLQMLIYPLVLISILSAVAKLHNTGSLGKIAGITITTLLLTTSIAALIGAVYIGLSGISAADLLNIPADTKVLDKLAVRNQTVQGLTIASWVLSFIPTNPFLDLTGARPTSIIATSIFATILGLAVLRAKKNNLAGADKIIEGIDIFQVWVAQLVRVVMDFTPYGVLALVTNMMAANSIKNLQGLGLFLVISYLALISIMLVHAFILSVFKLNPIRFYLKTWPALIFAFSSRSSAAAIPLNIEVQTRNIGIPASIASFAASFGATLGQNGCAGLYPAMLAAMIAPTMGINPLDPSWLLSLVVITTFSSVGVAGVGGGATFAALLVLPLMGLPIHLIALLIAVEPIIDMGRTAINVSGSMVAGAVTSQLLRQTDIQKFKADL